MHMPHATCTCPMPHAGASCSPRASSICTAWARYAHHARVSPGPVHTHHVHSHHARVSPGPFALAHDSFPRTRLALLTAPLARAWARSQVTHGSRLVLASWFTLDRSAGFVVLPAEYSISEVAPLPSAKELAAEGLRLDRLVARTGGTLADLEELVSGG